MIKITINGRKYKGAYSWEDISLRKYCELAAIPIPEGYKDFILADGKFSIEVQESVDEYVKVVTEITDEQMNIEFPAYYRKVISCLSNIPESVVIPDEYMTNLYDWYFKPFVVSLIYHTPLIHFTGQLKNYTPDILRKFNVGLSTYYIPETINILGVDVPMANEPIVTYTEASDIFRGMKLTGDDIHKLALFMAIYCRKKGEIYDQKKVLERKELFMSVPMSVVWSVFFCIIRRLPDCTIFSHLFGGLPKSIREIVQAAKTYQGMAAGDF